MTAARAPGVRRLPGFSFETRAPVYDDVLPRMDVAVFAGFAASGPLHVPVPVEDVAQFAAVFGADAALAWDPAAGRAAYAQLAPTVRAFFANGGRRCWVVRLAGEGASTNALPVPGVAAVAGATFEPLALAARSPGSWSDGVRLSASLTSRRFAVLGWRATDARLDLAAPSDAALEAGDLLRLTWRDPLVELYLGVESVDALADDGGGSRRSRLRVRPGARRWFDAARDPGAVAGEARWRGGRVAAARLDRSATPAPDADEITLLLSAAPADAPLAGEVVVARFGNDELVLAVRQTEMVAAEGSPPEPAIRVRGRGRWARSGASAAPAGEPSVELLRLALWARAVGGEGDALRAGELGLAPGHARHVERLPDDDAVYGPPDSDDAVAAWPDVVAPRFPAAGGAGRGEPRLCIPLGVGVLAEHYLPAEVPAGAALERDGLVPFEAALFADEALAGARSTTLLADAEYVRLLAPRPRERLAGVHAALAIEEATLVAVPDAAQPGWVAAERGEPLPPEPATVDADGPGDDDDFVDCGELLGPGPVLTAAAHDADGSVALAWTGADGSTEWLLEEATDRGWRDAAAVYAGPERSVSLGGRVGGDYYYRVRGTGGRPTDWSAGVAVRLTPGGGWRVRAPAEYRDDMLQAAHRLLLRFCAARRDAMAVLSLPQHYREDDALRHVRRLGAPLAPEVPLYEDPARRGPTVSPLSAGEREALGFAALYHGWVHTRDEDGAVRAVSPAGAACGVIARRAIERGAWVAPANEALRGVVAVERPAAPARWEELLRQQVNVLRQHARGFVVMSADTLAPDEEVRPVGVRRLLILLRREASRRGAGYVFEPNDDSFRRMVQRGFEALLGDLFRRGAFAGLTADSAFRVVTGEGLNTPRSVDAGRFVVELRVAPSRPMTFLTLRLVQTGERVLVTGA
ncbi:MAG TPA: hypothetical protein VKA84_23875 [Gemmatimonadaceae bacterium]|nr:hypothetical protein [Gemmatimonadaceae bacterium]